MSYIGSFIVTVIADVLHIVLSVVSFEAFFCLCDVAYICRRFLLVVRNEVTFVIKDGY